MITRMVGRLVRDPFTLRAGCSSGKGTASGRPRPAPEEVLVSRVKSDRAPQPCPGLPGRLRRELQNRSPRQLICLCKKHFVVWNRFSYCLSYTMVLFTLSPLAFVPFWVLVRVFPSLDTTLRVVITGLPAFLAIV